MMTWRIIRSPGDMQKIGFLLDMDGVMYSGSQLIPGAANFIEKLKMHRIPYRFLTNNSQRARRDVALKLRRLGIDAVPEDVFTCAMATARFLASQKTAGTAYVIGENGLPTRSTSMATPSSMTRPTTWSLVKAGRSRLK